MTGSGSEPSGPRHQITAPLQGTVVTVAVSVGDRVAAGSSLVVVESMKMEHPVPAPHTGTVVAVTVTPGDQVSAGDALIQLVAGGALTVPADEAVAGPLAARPDLDEVLARQAGVLDGGRPDVVARRHQQGRRTARENVDDLCDPGSFTEYGSLAIAAQRGRRPLDELIERTPADGLVAGVGRVNGSLFGEDRSSCAVLSYDYTVLAGTQGARNHQKKDRMFELIERLRLPVVLFAEGGGGRPGDTDYAVVTGLHTMAFALFAKLSGQVPSVGIASGWCFAGTAALLGCCDVIIATRDPPSAWEVRR